jgi:hypothetical protein
MEFSSKRWKQLAGLIKESASPFDGQELGAEDDKELSKPELSDKDVDHMATIYDNDSKADVNEDWDNYHSLEEIETKYYSKLVEALKTGRAELVKDIFKTALKDAKILGTLELKKV